ncbi:hypothetical protein [Paeniglutamicibacter sp. Y32M11]|uniref:hypothetical protein n=1 Tax=Paeniglutamicibacter sp. Y32M11 TaxID=2853258 RepID=UPI001C52A8BF|nr:hypothetical protein [Paeniglutamicibacter sp. Y32M11]QXQ10118.1 hypothetical protein KUF55_17060 [Paeniglutamicibacter sp. Y32M11]
MTSTNTKPSIAPPASGPSKSAHKKSSLQQKPRLGWGKLCLTMLIPFFLVTVMGLAYLGAFHQPAPHNLEVAIVGDTAATKVFAQSLKDEAGDSLSVRTIATPDAARALVADREVAAAFSMEKSSATLFISSAASETNAGITQKIFMPIAYAQHLPFQVEDVVPTGEHDNTGQGIFFLLVALSIGGYAGSVPLSGFMGKVKLPTRFVMAAASGAVVSTIALVISGPIYGVLTHSLADIWLISWLYTTAITTIGMGLHPILRHWTTATLTLCFVALNFTSSGGIFMPEVQPGLFAALNAFWNGAAWLHAVQTLTYFPSEGIGLDILKLALWLIAGIALMILTHAWSDRKTRLADEDAKISEVEQTIAA